MNRRILLLIFAPVLLALSTPSFAQVVPPRTYLKPYNGVWSVPLWYQSMSGNVNPTDPAFVLSPGFSFDSEILQTGYYKAFALTPKRAASLTAILNMGRVSGESAVFSESSSGFGDLMVEFNMHLNNAEPIYNNPMLMRYKPGFSVNLIADLVIPTGEYDDDQLVNLGQNRWMGRVGTPIVKQIGPWVPGRRTTLEVIPSVWLFGDNDDYKDVTGPPGATTDLETDPLFQVEAHLTRDLDEKLWVSLDLNWLSEGESEIDGVSGDSVDVLTVGAMASLPLTERLGLKIGYTSTVDDEGSSDVRADNLMVFLTYASGRLLRGIDRLKGHQ